MGCLSDRIDFRNEKYNRQNCFINDLLVAGDDLGAIHYIDSNNSILQSVSVSDSPIICMSALSDSQFLLSTDTETCLLQTTPSIRSVPQLIWQEIEEKADVLKTKSPKEADETEEVEEWMLQGRRSDYSRCSFEQFGMCRQQVFVCRTCRDQLDRFLMSKRPELTHEALSKFYNVGYLCEECAHFCHTNRGHDVVALGVKDNVKCDCGNRIFLQLDELGVSEEGHSFHSCYLCPGKPEWNPCNVYSHNCRERWCYCDEEERLPMVQCVKCCDWFHNDCAEKVWSETHEGQTIDLNDESIDFVCRDCEKKAGAPSASMAPSQSTFIGGGGEAGKSMETVETGETGETVEDAENEEDLEELIRVGLGVCCSL